MEENYAQNNEQNNHGFNNHDHHHSNCWIKYLVISLAAFFGAFLAVYFAVDVAMHKYYRNMPFYGIPARDNTADFVKQQERILDDITRFQQVMNPFMVNPVKIQTYQKDDAYKIVIDLKPFGGEPDKIKTDIKPKRVYLSGESEIKDGDSDRDISFAQNFSLPEKIDVKAVTKQVEGDNYVITLPIKD